jgi:hypothetical protein
MAGNETSANPDVQSDDKIKSAERAIKVVQAKVLGLEQSIDRLVEDIGQYNELEKIQDIDVRYAKKLQLLLELNQIHP